MGFLTGFLAYFIGFLHDLIAVPHVYYAAVVALFFGLATASRAGLVVIPLIAAIVFLAALVVGPYVISHAELVIPKFDSALAWQLLAAYVVFLVADTIVYIAKSVVLRAID
jgi:hypothetical protein